MDTILSSLALVVLTLGLIASVGGMIALMVIAIINTIKSSDM